MSTQVDGLLGSVDRNADRAAYRQIADQIGLLIENGTIAFNQKLPSETFLLEHYGVVRTTVRQALAELRSLGYVRSEQGRGVFASLRDVDRDELPLPGIHNAHGRRCLVRTISPDRAEVYRLLPALSPGAEAMELIGELRDLPEPSDFWPHYSWRAAGTDEWVGHELNVRDWQEAVDRLLEERA